MEEGMDMLTPNTVAPYEVIKTRKKTKHYIYRDEVIMELINMGYLNAKEDGTVYKNMGTCEHCGEIIYHRYITRGNKDHYEHLYLEYNGKRYNIAVHRIIWMFFNGKIPDGGVIHHINNIKLDNSRDNLILLTQSEHMSIHASHPHWGITRRHKTMLIIRDKPQRVYTEKELDRRRIINERRKQRNSKVYIIQRDTIDIILTMVNDGSLKADNTGNVYTRIISDKIPESEQYYKNVTFLNRSTITLFYDGNKYLVPIQYIVWLYFTRDLPNGYTISRKNNILNDNRINNLQLIPIE